MEWKIIDGFTDYRVSENGNVYSIKRNRILKPYERKNYLGVYLYAKNKRQYKLVHRLVANAFIPNPDNLPQINHKDENPSNNIVDNLEWCTSKYNCNYGTRNFRMSKSLSKKVYQYTLDNKLIKIWNSVNEASKFYNNWHISSCCLSKRKTACGYIWRYAD